MYSVLLHARLRVVGAPNFERMQLNKMKSECQNPAARQVGEDF
jgi:hypothetical protein